MLIDIAVRYYAKAVDYYPYDLTKVIEALECALSYDEKYVDALILMGRLHAEQLEMFVEARDFYERALKADPNNSKIYPVYSTLLINEGNYDRAVKMINYSFSVLGIYTPPQYYLLAIVYERLEKYTESIEALKNAKRNCNTKHETEFYRDEIVRVEAKKREYANCRESKSEKMRKMEKKTPFVRIFNGMF